MNIPVQKLLSKIEEELNHAKVSVTEESIREKVYSMKILCELILDENQVEIKRVQTMNPIVKQQLNTPSFSVNQPKKMVTDDNANGESLFDF